MPYNTHKKSGATVVVQAAESPVFIHGRHHTHEHNRNRGLFSIPMPAYYHSTSLAFLYPLIAVAGVISVLGLLGLCAVIIMHTAGPILFLGGLVAAGILGFFIYKEYHPSTKSKTCDDLPSNDDGNYPYDQAPDGVTASLPPPQPYQSGKNPCCSWGSEPTKTEPRKQQLRSLYGADANRYSPL